MDVPAGVTQEEGNTGFSIHLLSAVLALIFLARRIQPFLSLVDREVEFCVLTIFNRSTPVGHFYLFFSVRKIPFAGIELTSQRVRGYMVPLSYRGEWTKIMASESPSSKFWWIRRPRQPCSRLSSYSTLGAWPKPCASHPAKTLNFSEKLPD